MSAAEMAIVRMYVRQIEAGNKTLDDVAKKYKQAVKEALESQK